MIHTDLLYTDKGTADVKSDYFTDMGLECLKNILEDDEYGVFADTLLKPLYDISIIKERQNILKDFLSYPQLPDEMKEICASAQKNKFLVFDKVYSRVSPKRKLAENLMILNKTLEIPTALLASMRYKKFESKTLSDLYTKLDRPTLLKEIKAKINEISAWLISDCAVFSVEYGSAFKLKSSHVVSGGVHATHKKPPFIKQKKATHAEYEFEYDADFLLEIQISSLTERGVQNMSAVISTVNSQILLFCRNLYRQLLFYSSAVKIVNFGSYINCPPVFPEFSSDRIKARELYDFTLLAAASTKENIIPNDFFEEKAFYLISGANHGGKTTFLKSIGTAQLFTQCGLPVFAKGYDCPAYKSFISHFTRDEDTSLSSGKLAEELERFSRFLPLLKDSSLLLMNESFATTTEREGCDIASDVLRALSASPVSLLFVTHNYKLLKSIGDISKTMENGVELRSLTVSTGDSSSDRTYEIRPGEPQEEIHGLEYVLQNIRA